MRDAISLGFYGVGGGGGGDVPSGSIVIPPNEKGELIVSYDAYDEASGVPAVSEITVFYAKNGIIPDSAFKSIINYGGPYINITTCNLPKNIKEIKKQAFYGDQRLKLDLPTSLKIIGDQAFRYCNSLQIETIPASVVTIENRAFANCSKLQSITFLGTPESIDANTFVSCSNLTVLRVPWAQGAIAGAPWGATNATVIYNYKGE